MSRHLWISRAASVALFLGTAAGSLGGEVEKPSGLVLSGPYDTEAGGFTSPPAFLNGVVGANLFYQAGFFGGSTVIANVEGGTVWFDHEAFNRPPGVTTDLFSYTNPAAGAANQVDFHATMVGHILAGTGYVADSDPVELTLLGAGMAPYAELWSGGIATSFSATDLGSFETTTASVIAPYKAFFEGISGKKADVINSSWGGSDPAASSDEVKAIDGLARDNATVAFVSSAGNSGEGGVGAPGSAYNGITVGSLGGTSFKDPSEYSSRGPVDFYNPETNTTVTGVRAAVDIAAPGENLVAAAYLGATGSLGASTDPIIQGIVQDPPPTDRYFLNQAGTSFSAPIVAGGIALLKDAAKLDPILNLNAVPSAMDTRVVKSVLMAGADRTTEWDNGQAANGEGVIVTTQSLDYATGAGALNLEKAANVYLGGTRDVEGLEGGSIGAEGWDFGSVSLSAPQNDYVFELPFAADTEFTISLNWFAGRSFDSGTDTASDLSFADLNLGLWLMSDGVFSTLVAESSSIYNNSEFLRVVLAAGGEYGLRISLQGFVYDMTDADDEEEYGLAWKTAAVPEPGTVILLVLGGVWMAAKMWRGRRV